MNDCWYLFARVGYWLLVGWLSPNDRLAWSYAVAKHGQIDLLRKWWIRSHHSKFGKGVDLWVESWFNSIQFNSKQTFTSQSNEHRTLMYPLDRTRAIGIGPNVRESAELCKLSPWTQTCPRGTWYHNEDSIKKKNIKMSMTIYCAASTQSFANTSSYINHTSSTNHTM